jgi:polyphosphate glucokinase
VKRAIGIDIGGTGIKAAVVDISRGILLTERIRVSTPDGGEPEAIAQSCLELVERLDPKGSLAIGVCFPAVVRHGYTQSAANVSDRWIGLNAQRLFEKAFSRSVVVLNDADAAGITEMRFGAGKGAKGLTIMTTLGTGIGTALFLKDRLVPNAELGHLEIDGVDYETKASYAAFEREGLSFPEWAERLQRYYSTLERLFSPDLFIVGGGISKQHQQFLPLLKLKAKIVPAKTKNAAGIIGAALEASRVLAKKKA